MNFDDSYLIPTKHKALTIHFKESVSPEEQNKKKLNPHEMNMISVNFNISTGYE